MPVMLSFSKPVEDKKAVERALVLTSSRPVVGAWYWDGDQALWFRPRAYWPQHVKVGFVGHLDGVQLSPGVYATHTLRQQFKIGRSLIVVASASEHRMKVFKDRKLYATWPISTGRPGKETPNGTYLSIEKANPQHMVGEDYDIQVPYSVRFTWSGDFIHAAPWSVGSQGYANVSHGCVNLAPERAQLYYGWSIPGDPVTVTGSPKAGKWDDGYTVLVPLLEGTGRRAARCTRRCGWGRTAVPWSGPRSSSPPGRRRRSAGRSRRTRRPPDPSAPSTTVRPSAADARSLSRRLATLTTQLAEHRVTRSTAHRYGWATTVRRARPLPRWTGGGAPVMPSRPCQRGYREASRPTHPASICLRGARRSCVASAMTYDEAVDQLVADGYTRTSEDQLTSLGTDPLLGFRLAGTDAEHAASCTSTTSSTPMGLDQPREERAGRRLGLRGRHRHGRRRDAQASSFAGVPGTDGPVERRADLRGSRHGGRLRRRRRRRGQAGAGRRRARRLVAQLRRRRGRAPRRRRSRS